MENKWKKLQIDNLPPDILTGEYEFSHGEEKIKYTKGFPIERLLYDWISDEVLHKDIYYRRKEKPAHTHEQIMSLWWFDDSEYMWVKVVGYRSQKPFPYVISQEEILTSVSDDWFTDKKSAEEYPPEANNE